MPVTRLIYKLLSRRRLKIIPNAFGEKAVLKLMFSAMIRAAERWRNIRITDIERRQLRAIRHELDELYEVENGFAKPASTDASQTEISSTSQT